MEPKKVKIIIRKGVAWLVEKPLGIAVEIMDCDYEDIVPEVYNENEEINETNKLDDTKSNITISHKQIKQEVLKLEDKITINDNWNVMKVDSGRKIYRDDVKDIYKSVSKLNFMVTFKNEKGMFAYPVERCHFFIED